MIKNLPILLLTIIIVSLFSPCVWATENINNDSVMVYDVDADAFFEFAKTPSIDCLEQKAYTIYSYSNSVNEGYIVVERVKNGAVDKYESPVGWPASIKDLPVYNELIDFFTDYKEIENFLAGNGITGTVENVVIISASFPASVGIPNIAWIKVGQEDYFIKIGLNYEEMLNHNMGYKYQIYTYAEFNNEFALKNGKLVVNDNDITEGNYVKIQHGGAYLPLRAVMEALGATVEWNDENSTVLLVCNDKRYILETVNGPKLYQEGQPWNLLEPPPGGPWGAYTYQMIDDRIIMDNKTMGVLVSLMDAKIELDYDGLIINVKIQ